MSAPPRRRRGTRSLSSTPASPSKGPAKKPPQSVRAFPGEPFVQLSDLVASSANWSAMVVVMCGCGWDMEMHGAAAYCTNPCCKLRTRIYHVAIKVREVDGIRV